MPKKCILILLDGLGDRPCQVLDDQTPLQAARTPVLDKLAAGGASGLFHAMAQGQALPSETAHFLMFGYDLADFPGRGALEALGAGIDISMGDVALLSHFATLSEMSSTLVLDRGKPDAGPDEIKALSGCIKRFRMDNDIAITFHPTGGIRGILTLRGDASPFITDSDPFTDGSPLAAILPWQKFKADPAALKSARTLGAYLSWAFQKLSTHKVNQDRTRRGMPLLNGLATQRAGRLKPVDPFFDKYGLRGLSLASGMVYWGLAACIGMDSEEMTDSGDPGADMEKRLTTAKNALADYDFVHVHTKTPDEAAHKKDPLLKKSVIESLDAGIGRAINPILEDPDTLVLVTADHSTPSTGPLIHSGESVPLVISGMGVRQDNVTQFDEVSAAQGVLGAVHGKELMYLILNHLERSKLVGIMDTPVDQPYWPGNYEPFKLVPVKKKMAGKS